MLKTPGVMPARGGAIAVLEAQPYNGGVARLAIGEGDRPPLPEKKSPRPTFFHGLPELIVLILPREGRSRPQAARSHISLKAKPRRHCVGNPFADVPCVA